MRKHAILLLLSLIALGVIFRSVNAYRAFRCYRDATNRPESPQARLPLIEEAIRLAPTNETYHRDAAGRCIEIALDSPDRAEELFDAAEQHLLTALRLEPSNAAAHYLLGQYYFIRRDFGRADEQFDKVLALAPCNANFFHRIGRHHLQLGNRKWVKEFRRVLSLAPGWLSILLDDLSINPYDLRALAGTSWPLRLAILDGLREKGRQRDALEICLAFCREADHPPDGGRPASEATKAQLALGLRRLNENLLAVTFLERWLEDAPKSLPLRRELAFALLRGGDKERALALATELEKQADDDIETMVLLGMVHEANGASEAAACEFAKAIEAQPRKVDHHLRLIHLHLRAKRYQTALDLCDRMVKLLPNSAIAHATRADVLLARNDRKAALSAYKAAARLDPEETRYRSMIDMLEKGSTRKPESAPQGREE